MTEELNWQELSTIAREAYARSDFDGCESYFRKAQGILEKLGGSDIRLGYACMMIGLCRYQRREYKEAADYFKIASLTYKQHGVKLVVDNLYWWGYCLFKLKLWKDASRVFLDGVEAYHSLKRDNQQLLADLLTNAAATLWFDDRTDQSKAFFEEAINAASSLSLSLIGYLSQFLTEIVSTNASKNLPTASWSNLADRACDLLRAKRNENKPLTLKKVNQSDDYFGTSVSDPYRWLEEISSAEVKEWIKQQNTYSDRFFIPLPKTRKILQRAFELRPNGDSYLPEKKGKYFYYQWVTPGLKRLQLFRVKKLGQSSRVVMDGNKLSEHIEIEDIHVSNDGKYAACVLSENGSEWRSLVIHNLHKDKPFRETLKDLCWAQLLWKADGSGFYYSTLSRLDPKLSQRVYFHKVGTPQEEDEIIYQSKNSSTKLAFRITEDNNYLVLFHESISDLAFSIELKQLQKPSSRTTTILDKENCPSWCVGDNAQYLYFITCLDAPLGRLVALSITKSSNKKPILKEIIPEQEYLLRDAYIYPDYIVAHYVTDKGTVLRRTNYDGEILGEVSLPAGAELMETSDAGDTNRFLAIEGFLYPRQIFHYKSKRDEISLVNKSSSLFDSSKYITKRLFIKTKDDVKLLVYLSHKKGLKRNSNNATILSVYGGFGECNQPWYSGRNIAWMESGGIFAHAIVRGDGGFGWNFEIAGKRKNKQTTISDLIAIAEYLIDKHYTCSAKLGIMGTSHGGLVAACALTKRPDLFGAVAIVSAPLDMLLHTKEGLSQRKIGEYGTAENEDDFRILYSYSPLHRIRSAIYPAVLVLTGENDDNVNPAHSYKFVAALQNSQLGTAPILLRTEKNTGHLSQHMWPRIAKLSFFIDNLCS